MRHPYRFVLCLLAVALASSGLVVTATDAFANEAAVLVLHTAPFSPSGGCSAVRNVDCTSPANVSMTSGVPTDVFLLLYEARDARAVQVRFVTPPGWQILGWHNDCVSNGLRALSPVGTGGQLSVAFDPVTAGSSGTIPIGALTILPSGPGCITLERTPDATGFSEVNFVTRDLVQYEIPVERRGVACVGSGGVDGCSLGLDLESKSWGGIKNRWNRN